MRNLLLLFLLICLISPAYSEVLLEDNFNSSDDWTVVQPTGSDNYCDNDSCGVPGDWTGYYNGANYCDGASDEPGNNNFYIDQYAGYPDETNTSRGGSGKSVTFWDESCTDTFVNSDGQLDYHLDSEEEEIYLRFYMRFKDSFELDANQDMQHKFFHIQHYIDGSPHSYFGANTGNQPVISGGISQYSTTIQFYVEGRCLDTYACHAISIWSISSVETAFAEGGIFDGDWHCYEIRVKANSAVGVADGLVEIWVDGNKLTITVGYTANDFEFTDTGESVRGWKYINIGGNTNNRFDTSCSDTADCEQWYAIDDVVVSTEAIGTDYVIGEEESSTTTMQGVSLSGTN